MTKKLLMDSKKHHCSEFLDVVNLILDNEATEDQENFVREHIEDCTGCLEKYELEKKIKELLQTKISKKPVPLNLANEIRVSIQSITE